MPLTNKKPWYASKTIWVNFVMFILAMIQTDLVLSLNLPAEVVATVITVANLILRVLTYQPIVDGH